MGAKVIVIGPSPVWPDELQRILQRDYLANGVVPKRLNPDASLMGLDRVVGTIAERNNVSFLSIAQRLCDGDGCLVTLNDDKPYPVQFDRGHFTGNGSVYLAKKLFDPLFSPH